MTIVRQIFGLCLFIALCAVCAWAQPRPAATPGPKNAPAAPAAATGQPASAPTPAPPPATLKAKYEGGVFGYNKKQEGTLNFDEVNSRLVFRNKEGKEMLSFPYESLKTIYPDTKSVRPAAATVASAVPLPYGANIAAYFIKKKQRYLTFQFVPVGAPGGLTSFRIDDKALLFSVIVSLCEKAELRQQGDACYK